MHEHSHDGRTKSNWDNTQKWPQEVNPLTSFNPLTKQLQQVNQSCVCWCSLFGASWLAWQRPTPRVYVWINLCCQCSDSSMSHSCYIKLLLFDRLTADRCAIPRNIRLLSDSAHHTQQVWDDSFFTVPFSEVCFTSEILWSLKWKSVMDFIFTQASLKKIKWIKISIFMVTPDLFLCWHGEFVAGDEAAHLLQRKAQKLLALHHISKMLLWETQTPTAHIKHCPSKQSLNENMFVVFAVQDT